MQKGQLLIIPIFGWLLNFVLSMTRWPGIPKILQKHIKRQIISLDGGFQVVTDLMSEKSDWFYKAHKAGNGWEPYNIQETYYSCRQTKSSNLLTDFLGLRKVSELVDNGINGLLLMSFIDSNRQNFQKWRFKHFLPQKFGHCLKK